MKIQHCLWVCAAAIGVAQGVVGIAPGFAHEVEISGEVGGTVHIEPNDTPRAGEASQAWFALVKQGGTSIPLADCDCQLAVYQQPYTAGDTPVQQPLLQPVSQEGYANIPGAKITFPQVGAYVLVMQGKPKTGTTFQPFELKFEVTVATGNTTPPATSPTPTPPSPAETPGEPTPATQQESANQESTNQESAKNGDITQPNGVAWAAGAGLVTMGAIAAILRLKRRK